MRTTKKINAAIVSFALAMLMLFGTVPVAVFAQDETLALGAGVTLLVDNTTRYDDAPRKDRAKYKTLGGAYRAALAGDTIKLMSDITGNLNISKALNFDFNGYTLTCPYSSSSSAKDSGIYTSAEVTIKDSDPEKKGKLVIATNEKGEFYAYGLRVSASGNLIIEDCHIVAPESPATKKNFFALDAPSGKATIRGTFRVEGEWSEEAWANGSVLFAMRTSGNSPSSVWTKVEDGAVVDAPGGIINGDNLFSLAPVWFEGDSARNANVRGTVGQVGVKLDRDYKLQADTNIGFLVPENQKTPITLDLNGFDISTLGQSGYIYGGSKVKIINSKSDHTSLIRCGGAPNINRIDSTIAICGDLTIDGNINVVNEAPESYGAFCIDQDDSKPSISVELKDCSLYSKESIPLRLLKGQISMENVSVSTTLDESVPGEHTGVMLSSTKVNTLSEVDFIAKNIALSLDSGTSSDPIDIHNVTVNKDAVDAAVVGIKHSGPVKLTITGQDSYYICDKIYDGSDDTLAITAGVYSQYPEAYVDTSKYIILPYRFNSAHYIVLPKLKVDKDNIVKVKFLEGAATDATARDTIDITYAFEGDSSVGTSFEEIKAAVDPDNVLGNMASRPGMDIAKDMRLSFSDSDATPIDGVSIADYDGTKRQITVDVSNDIRGQDGSLAIALDAYLWIVDACIGPVKIDIARKSNGYDVGGDVSNSDGNKLKDIEIKLTQGNATMYGPEYTDTNGKYQFKNILPGIYNLVATSGDKIVTSIITVDNRDLRENVTIPIEQRNSILEVKGEDTPAIVVGNLDVIADGYVFSHDESKVVIKLAVEKVAEGTTEKKESHAAIRAEAEALHQNEKIVILFLDAVLKEKVDAKEPVDIGDINNTVLEVVIPFDVTGKNHVEVFRNHKNTVEQFTVLHEKPKNSFIDKTFYMDSGANLIHVYAQKYSDYAITYTKSSCNIISSADTGGSISPSGMVSVNIGESQTFTITPNNGYRIADVLVDGASVGAVSSYQFANVKGDHTIAASFTSISGGGSSGTGGKPWSPESTDAASLLQTNDHIKYIHGYEDLTVGPERKMTRAEAAQMFYNLLLDKKSSAQVPFPDVNADAWYAEAVGKLAAMGVFKGYADGTFGAENFITREEFCTIATRFTSVTGTEISALGWVNGYANGSFLPNDTITRSEVVSIVNNMLGRKADIAFLNAHKNMVKFTDLQNQKVWYYDDMVEASTEHEYVRGMDGIESWTGAGK